MSLNPISDNITKVLKLHPHQGSKYLRQMAEHGFAPVAELTDPVVEMIVRSNIGGIVTQKTSIIVGLPDTIWNYEIDGRVIKFDSSLIPTSESARNAIAILVLYFEQERCLDEERRWWNRIRFWRRK
jgi:hypothetical protein